MMKFEFKNLANLFSEIGHKENLEESSKKSESIMLEKEKNQIEIKLINIESLNEKLFNPFNETAGKIKTILSEQENNKYFQSIISTYLSLPEKCKRLFRFKTKGIYGLPHQYDKWSGYTCISREDMNKSLIILNAKSVKERDPKKVLMHELGHTLDFDMYPHHNMPEWAWDFFYKFEKIISKEPEPIEGIDRDEEKFFGSRNEEWASRLSATITSLYLPEENTVTALKENSLRIEEFKKEWPQSYKFFVVYIKKLEEWIDLEAKKNF